MPFTSEAKRIAREALERAAALRSTPAKAPSKAEILQRLEAARASCGTAVVLCPAQPAPERKQYRRPPNLKELAFAEVLADGAALLAARGAQCER